MKRCSRCGLEKPEAEFYRRGRWLFNPCRPCKRVDNAERHAANRDRNLAKMRQYAKANRAAIDAKIKEWRAAHPEKIKVYGDRHYRKHHDKRLAYMAKRREEHRDRLNAWLRDYHKAHPELSRERGRKWRAENIERARLSSRKHASTRLARKRGAFVEPVHPLEVYDRGGGICGICQEPVSPDNFNVDHIIPLARGGEHSYANTQPAHPSCNFRKGAKLPEELAA